MWSVLLSFLIFNNLYFLVSMLPLIDTYIPYLFPILAFSDNLSESFTIASKYVSLHFPHYPSFGWPTFFAF